LDLQPEQEQALESLLQGAKQLVQDMPQKAAAAVAQKKQAETDAAAAAGEPLPVAAQPSS
jgi:hypothetical protein